MSVEAQTTVLPPKVHRLPKDKHANIIFAKMLWDRCTSAVGHIIRVLERGA